MSDGFARKWANAKAKLCGCGGMILQVAKRLRHKEMLSLITSDTLYSDSFLLFHAAA